MVLAVAASAQPASLGAQIRGVVTEAGSGRPIPGATILLFGADSALASALAVDRQGEFVLSRARLDSAEYVSGAAFGYWTSPLVAIQPEWPDGFRIRFALQIDAVEVPGVTVSVGSHRRGRERFAARMATEEGIFLTPLDVLAMDPRHPGDVFAGLEDEDVRLTWTYGSTSLDHSGRNAIPRILSARGRGCFTYFLNEVPVFQGHPGTGSRSQWSYYPLSAVLPTDIRAVEIYRSLREVPPEFKNAAVLPVSVAEAEQGRAGRREAQQHPGSPRSIEEVGCGVVIIWTLERW